MTAESPSSSTRSTQRRRTASGAVDGRSTRTTRDTPLSEMVRQQILASIHSGELAPNDVINTGQLAEKYGVSRTPVREALGALERAGVLTVLPYRGHVVRPLSLEDALDIYFVRELIETEAAERAATRMSDEALAQLEALGEAHSASGAGSGLAFDEQSYEFHRKIAEAAGSPRLLSALEMIFSDSQRLNLVGSGLATSGRITDDHTTITAALRLRDPKGAREAMRKHLRGLYEGILDSLARP
ncbi:GntR family transcriptional regulator [Rhodococcus sp. NPDC057529]|uniref:GntR family transcriptional regulator n=1 Tax=Rhodococcus sp. NPDC057529 TaxID=3346158 RepID=UPI00366F5D2E